MIYRPRLPWVFFVTIGLIGAFFGLSAQSADDQPDGAEDVWLRAYMIMREGESREREGKDLEALAKYREAQRLFDFIARKHVNWRPEMIEFRRQALAQKSEDVKQRLETKNAPQPRQQPQQPPANSNNQYGSPNGSVVTVQPNGDAGSPMFNPAPNYPQSAPNNQNRPQTVAPSMPMPSGTQPQPQIMNLSQEFNKIQAEVDRLTGENRRLQVANAQNTQQLQSLQTRLADAKKIEKQLQNQLNKALDELEKARTQDGSRVKELEAQLQMATAQLRDANAKSAQILSELEKAKGQLAGPGSKQPTPVEIAKLQGQLAQAQMDLDKALKERDAARADSQTLSTDKTADQLAVAEAKVKELNQTLQQVQSQMLALRAQTSKERNDTQNKLDSVTVEKNALARKLEAELAKSGELSAENKELLAELEKSKESMAKLNEQVLDLSEERDRLQEDNKQLELKLANVTQERDQLRKDLDEMAIILHASDHIDGDIKDMFAANRKWQEELSAAKKEIEDLTAREGNYKTEISGLKRRLESVQKEREQLLVDNEKYQQTVEDLNGKLAEMLTQLETNTQALDASNMKLDRVTKERDEAKQGLATAKVQVAELASLPEENDLLRGLIRKQLVTQARLKQARDMVFEELQKVDNQSQTLMASLDEMVNQPLELSSEEKAMFKDPADQELIEELETMTFETAQKLNPVPSSAEMTSVEMGNGPTILDEGEVAAGMVGPSREERISMLSKAANYDFSQGDIKAAEKGYEEVLNLDRRNVYALCNLGIIRIRQGKYNDASELLQRTLAHKTTYAPAHYYLGVVRYKQRQLDEALESFGQCVRYDVNNANAHNYIGLIASEKGWGTKAESEFRAAVTLNPNHADAHFNLAVLYATRENPSKELAREFYQRALRSGAERDAAIEQIIGNS